MEDWRTIAQWLWGVLVPVGIWAWRKQDARLDALEKNTVTKDAVAERRIEVDKQLEDRRQDVRELHAKIDDRAGKLNDKIDGLVRDVNKGFSDIKDLLLRRIGG